MLVSFSQPRLGSVTVRCWWLKRKYDEPSRLNPQENRILALSTTLTGAFLPTPAACSGVNFVRDSVNFALKIDRVFADNRSELQCVRVLGFRRERGLRRLEVGRVSLERHGARPSRLPLLAPHQLRHPHGEFCREGESFESSSQQMNMSVLNPQCMKMNTRPGFAAWSFGFTQNWCDCSLPSSKIQCPTTTTKTARCVCQHLCLFLFPHRTGTRAVASRRNTTRS